MVQNPFYTTLTNLRSSISTCEASIREALDKPAKCLENGAWQGPTAAQDFSSELSGRRNRLGVLMDTILEDVDARIARTEPEVPESAALGFSNILAADGIM